MNRMNVQAFSRSRRGMEVDFSIAALDEAKGRAKGRTCAASCGHNDKTIDGDTW
jgi:hypothetical protein